MAHIKSHLGCSNSPWRNKKRRGALDWVPQISCAAKSTSNTKYIHHLHPFTTNYILLYSSILCWKKRFQLCNCQKWKIHENAKHTLYQNTTALARERHSNCAELSPKTQHHRHRPEQLEFHRILVPRPKKVQFFLTKPREMLPNPAAKWLNGIIGFQNTARAHKSPYTVAAMRAATPLRRKSG